MTIIDANYFLRAIVHPETPRDREMADIAIKLFRDVRDVKETILVTDAIVAEVVFILSSKRHYGLPRSDVVARLAPILQLSGCQLNRKRFVQSALDRWASSQKLSFVDSLSAVYAEELGEPLASFDAELGKVPGIELWKPSPENRITK